MPENVNDKMWGGRFAAAPDKLVEQLSESISFDWRLAEVDILGSQAHAQALSRIGILTEAELVTVLAALEALLVEIQAGKINFKAELEDVHMNIEALLTERIGDLGKRIHTGRSRNDQVATDLRLYSKQEITFIIERLRQLQHTLVKLADQNRDVIMPGFTHMQIAQPVLFAHHILAYFEMFQRDKERLLDCFKRMDKLVLGSAALAGSTYGQDRQYIAEQLSFSAVTANSMDAVSDRDFVVEFISAASLIMMHLSRFSEELILWLSPQFRFVTIADEFTTGSSIMPQKRNPDVAELTRGKTGRVYGNLMSILTVLKGLPLTYNRDLQEDKEPLFDTVDTLRKVLPAFTAMLSSLKVNTPRLKDEAREGFSVATDLADLLTRKGVPFRDAHRIVGNLVKFCEQNHKYLDELQPEEIAQFVPADVKLPLDLSAMLTPEASIRAREISGGTGYNVVDKAMADALKILGD